MFNKLSPRDAFMIVVLMNVIMYYLGYQFIVSPLLNRYMDFDVKLQEVQLEHDNIMLEISKNQEYLQQITKLLEERRSLYEVCFPKAETEVVHKFMNEMSKKAQVSINSIKIDPKKEMATTESGEEIESIFKNNEVTLSISGSYKNLVDFMTDIESLKRSSAVNEISVNNSNNGTSSIVTINMLTVEKDVEDEIFDYTFQGGTGGTSLNMN